MMIHSPEFRVADLLAQAGDEAFQAAGSDVREIDGPHEDEWSLGGFKGSSQQCR